MLDNISLPRLVHLFLNYHAIKKAKGSKVIREERVGNNYRLFCDKHIEKELKRLQKIWIVDLQFKSTPWTDYVVTLIKDELNTSIPTSY